MGEKRFSIGEAVSFGWKISTGNVLFFIVVFVVLGVLNFVLGRLSVYAETAPAVMSGAIALFSIAIGLGIEIGLTRIALKFCDEGGAKFSDLFDSFPLMLKYLASQILYAIMVMAGLIMLVVPGIILMLRFGLYGYFIVDKGMGPIEALKKSFVATKGSAMNLFNLGILLFLINFAGLLCLAVGLIISIPISMVASAYVYRKLAAQPGAAS